MTHHAMSCHEDRQICAKTRPLALRLRTFSNKKDRKRAFVATNGQLGPPVTSCRYDILSRGAENFSEYQAYQGKMYHPIPYRYPFCPRIVAFHGHNRPRPGQFGSIWDTTGPILARHNGATAAQAAATAFHSSSTSTTTQSVPDRPNVSGAYISSALAGGATKLPGVVALAM